MNVQSNWWETFFTGVAVDMWLQAVPEDHTRREADRLEKLLEVAPGADVLDIPCGAGRLALVLAQRGYRMTGVDWSFESLQHARRADASSDITWEQRDMRDLPWPGRFDAAFCLGNSFGYLDDEGNHAFLRAVRQTLKQGARFVLETPMVLENVLLHIQPRPWWKAGNVYLLVENQYDAARGRLDIEYTFAANGRIEVRRGSHRAYAYRELVELLESSGFSVNVAEPWTREAHVVSFLATAV
ncbi:MAG: class I SAM-dependent methyltransferase [Vicinamibacterales bacterium]